MTETSLTNDNKRVCLDTATSLCSSCGKVNFPVLLDVNISEFLGRRSLQLGRSTSNFRDPTCPVCHFVRTALNETPGLRVEQRHDEDFMVVVDQEVTWSDALEDYGCAPSVCLEFKARVPGRRDQYTTLGRFVISSVSDRMHGTKHLCDLARRPRRAKCDIALLYSWLQDSHSLPGEERAHRVPIHGEDALLPLIRRRLIRVIDVTRCQVVTLTAPVRYVALSYVWGGISSAAAVCRSRHDTDPNPDEGFPSAWAVDSARLPQTILDAMSFVREMGERFLWVDSLCIDQDSHSDRSEIIGEMDTIYYGAYFTIIATEGSDADAGLSRLHAPPREEQKLSFIQKGFRLDLLPEKSGLPQLLENTAWNWRGWTFQERSLSTRCFYFTEEEVFFTCRGREKREHYVLLPSLHAVERYVDTSWMTESTITRSVLTLTTDADSRNDGTVHHFNDLLYQYSRRMLSYETDRLNAFLGTLKRFAQLDKADAVYGLLGSWQAFMACLLWQPVSPSSSRRICASAAGKGASPSWSWVGWTGAVRLKVVDLQTMTRYRPVVLDEANIQCYVEHGWPSVPERCKITGSDQVVLHLWRPLLKCSLSKSHISREGNLQFYKILWSSDMGQNVGLSWLTIPAAAATSPIEEGKLYDFVHLGNVSSGSTFLLMVERNGRYWSRIALSQRTSSKRECARIFESPIMQGSGDNRWLSAVEFRLSPTIRKAVVPCEHIKLV